MLGTFSTVRIFRSVVVLLLTVSSGKGTLTTEAFPFDLDTTSIGLTVMERDEEVVMSVMDEMLQYIDSDGIVLVRSTCSVLFPVLSPLFRPILTINDRALTPLYASMSSRSSTPTIASPNCNRLCSGSARYFATGLTWTDHATIFLVWQW